MAVQEYLPRLLDPSIADLFRQLPAILIVGPRASGKTTTARRHARTVVRLDRPAEADAIRVDPDAVLRALPEPVLLDEWQVVPEALGAVKRAVDDDPRPGRFILTGSVNADLDAPTWPGTGRVLRLPMYGLTVGELECSHRDASPTFLQRLISIDLDAFSPSNDPLDIASYIDLASRSGYPEPAARLHGHARSSWLRSYLDQVVTRDIPHISPGRDPAKIRRFVEAQALNTAGVVTEQTLLTAADINRDTAKAYDQLLTNLYLVQPVPAWTTNRLSRLIKAPKRYFVDPGLVFAALNIDVQAVLRDSDLLGRIIDTFALAQLRPQLALEGHGPRLHHLRDRDGKHEIDLVVELPGGTIVALEFKAAASIGSRDCRHLEWLRDQLGDRFVAGAVMHTGPRAYRMSDRILALPLCTLWS